MSRQSFIFQVLISVSNYRASSFVFISTFSSMMNQLGGKYVNVVLSVESGRGMDFLKNSVHIVGNFNNRILESDKVTGEESPCFNTELVWEIEKKELRKIRSANQPLRVECITTDPYNRRERVGFSLLSLRTAQVIPQKFANQEIHFTWHKLIGCQGDKKKCHPELYLSLAVRDHLLSELETCNSVTSMPYISEEDTLATEDPIQSKIPLKYFEDGHIQVGESDGLSIFHLNLFIKKAVNLDALLPEILVFQQIRKSSFLSFKLLGIAIKTKTFQKELHDTINLNEKIVVNLLSTRDILKTFFHSQNVTISFVCGTDKLGVTSYELHDVFNTKEDKCFFKYPSPNGIIPFNSSDKSPYIQIQTWIDEDSPNFEDNVADKIYKPKTVFSTASKSPAASADPSELKMSRIGDEDQGDMIKPFVTKSVQKIIKAEALSPTPPLDQYEKYVLEITLKYLIWRAPPPDTRVMFKFLHPKAASCITIFTEINNKVGEQIPLNNLVVKMGYISTESKIQKLLNVWPPRLFLADEKERNFCEEQEFSVNCLNEYSVDYDITLRGIRTLEPLAKVGVKVTMRKCEISDVEEYETLFLLPIVLDEIITVKEITELEAWKNQEHTKFQTELEKVKEQEVKKLQAEWEEKKSKLEEQLQKTVTKCHGLQEDLRSKLNAIKTDKALQRKANGSNMYIDIFKNNWKIYSSENSKEVIELLSRTQRDNEILKEIIGKQREKLKKMEKTALTKSQTSGLLKELKALEEKFLDVQSAKSYFKNQWKRAVEEIHDLRTEDIKNMQLQIKESREELSKLSLDGYGELENGVFGDCNINSTRSLKSTLFYP